MLLFLYIRKKFVREYILPTKREVNSLVATDNTKQRESFY